VPTTVSLLCLLIAEQWDHDGERNVLWPALLFYTACMTFGVEKLEWCGYPMVKKI